MKHDIRLAVCLVFAVSLSLALFTLWKVWAAKARELDDINLNSLNIAQALDTYSESIMRQSSTLLIGLVERLEAEGTGKLQIERIRNLVTRQQDLLVQLNTVAIYDHNGNWIMTSGGSMPENANSADREFFLYHRDNTSRADFIGPPVRSRSTDEWVITVSRRFDNPQGQFAGVVAVTLGIENFLKLFGKIDVGLDGAISLSYADGRILVRYPFREQDMGRDVSKSPIFTRYLVNSSVGTASLTSSLDGVARLYAFRRNEHLPLVTTIAVGRDEALAAWKKESILSAGVVLALLGIIGTIGWLLIQDIRRRAETQAQLVVAREQLIQTNQQLELLASLDALTGIANRRNFDERLAIEAQRAHREGTQLALLMIDIDYFKYFNDTYGHVAGDECLRTVSQTLKGCLKRPSDYIARYGGEELAVILANTDNNGALNVATLMLEALKRLHIAHAKSPFEHVTVSIGAASAAGELLFGRQLTLIEAADQALYRAKAAGRNQVMLAGSENIHSQPCSSL